MQKLKTNLAKIFLKVKSPRQNWYYQLLKTEVREQGQSTYQKSMHISKMWGKMQEGLIYKNQVSKSTLR